MSTREQLTDELLMLSAQMLFKHVMFCRHFLLGDTQITAYKKAGYKFKSEKQGRSQASNLFAREDVQLYLSLSRQLATVSTVIDIQAMTDSVMTEFGRIAFFNIKNVFTDNGAVKSMDQFTEDDGAAIQSVKTRLIKRYKENEEEEVITDILEVEVKQWDKLKALDSLVKILRLEPQKEDDPHKVGLSDVVQEIQEKEQGLPQFDD